jgi:hypothetical protein
MKLFSRKQKVTEPTRSSTEPALDTVAINKITDIVLREKEQRKRFLSKFNATPLTADVYAEWVNVNLKSSSPSETIFNNHDFVSSTNHSVFTPEDETYWEQPFWLIDDLSFSFDAVPQGTGSESLSVFIHPTVPLTEESVAFLSSPSYTGVTPFGHTDVFVFGFWKDNEFFLNPRTTAGTVVLFKDTVDSVNEMSKEDD